MRFVDELSITTLGTPTRVGILFIEFWCGEIPGSRDRMSTNECSPAEKLNHIWMLHTLDEAHVFFQIHFAAVSLTSEGMIT